MPILRKFIFYSVAVCSSLAIIGVGAGFLVLQDSLTQLDGERIFNELTAPVKVTSDKHDIPVVTADDHFDTARLWLYHGA